MRFPDTECGCLSWTSTRHICSCRGRWKSCVDSMHYFVLVVVSLLLIVFCFALPSSCCLPIPRHSITAAILQPLFRSALLFPSRFQAYALIFVSLLCRTFQVCSLCFLCVGFAFATLSLVCFTFIFPLRAYPAPEGTLIRTLWCSCKDVICDAIPSLNGRDKALTLFGFFNNIARRP